MEENEIYAVDNHQKSMPSGDDNGKGKNGGKYFWCGLITGLVFALLIVSGVYLANRIQNYLEVKADAEKHLSSDKDDEDEDEDDKEDEKDKDKEDEEERDTAIDQDTIDKMRVIETIINVYYYQEDVDRDALETGIYKGLVSALGDPYSEYYSAEELAALYDNSAGIYYGIGAYVQMDTDASLPRLTGIIAGTPAEEADLRPDDLVYKIEGEEMYGYTLQEAVSMMKGEEGTYVNITIVRDGEEIEKTVERRKVESPTVNSEMFDNGIAYIQITEFDEITIDQFAEALAVARGKGMNGLILDLRANPGGNLNSVVEISRMLLPEGLIVYTEDRDGDRVEYKCDGTREIDVPMVVLVDGNSASASEILAGAIKDYGVGTLLGTTTFGKGIVQRPVELSDGSAVKLTVSSYYTPNGTNIHGIGIEPDVVVEFDSDRYYSDEEYDNQLEEAKKLLLEMIETIE